MASFSTSTTVNPTSITSLRCATGLRKMMVGLLHAWKWSAWGLSSGQGNAG
jgi:hypothetical protein